MNTCIDSIFLNTELKIYKEDGTFKVSSAIYLLGDLDCDESVED
jgi:hypothetical protein